MPNMPVGPENMRSSRFDVTRAYTMTDRRSDSIAGALNKNGENFNPDTASKLQRSEVREAIIRMGVVDRFLDWAFHSGRKAEALNNLADMLTHKNPETRAEKLIWLLNNATSEGLKALQGNINYICAGKVYGDIEKMTYTFHPDSILNCVTVSLPASSVFRVTRLASNDIQNVSPFFPVNENSSTENFKDQIKKSQENHTTCVLTKLLNSFMREKNNINDLHKARGEHSDSFAYWEKQAKVDAPRIKVTYVGALRSGLLSPNSQNKTHQLGEREYDDWLAIPAQNNQQRSALNSIMCQSGEAILTVFFVLSGAQFELVEGGALPFTVYNDGQDFLVHKKIALKPEFVKSIMKSESTEQYNSNTDLHFVCRVTKEGDIIAEHVGLSRATDAEIRNQNIPRESMPRRSKI